MLFVGIDPGVSGGLALVDERGQVIAVERMPATDADVIELLRSWRRRANVDGAELRAFVEHVHAMPAKLAGRTIGHGSIGSFKLGQSFGALCMACTAAFVPYELVGSQRWQRALGCLSKGDKRVTKAEAQRRFPGVRGVTHAIADALLLAEYGRRCGVVGRFGGLVEAGEEVRS